MPITRLSLPIILLLGSIGAATAQNTLTLNVTGQPPLNTIEQTGFMDEITAEAMSRIGYQLKTTRLPAERALKRSNSGDIDGEMSRIKGMERAYSNLIRVDEKIMDWQFVLFSHKPVPMANGWKSLSGESLAFITGWKILEARVPKDAAITMAGDSKQLFQLLKRKRVNAVIYERWAGLNYLRKLDIIDAAPQPSSLSKREMFIYLNKKHIDIAGPLAEGLKSMKEDGTYEALVKKHLK